uniref:RNA exonuclease 4 n=1 Tax=Plectus sambesii TaxID=2011161 RepID=A0A914X7D5_9BILA
MLPATQVVNFSENWKMLRQELTVEKEQLTIQQKAQMKALPALSSSEIEKKKRRNRKRKMNAAASAATSAEPSSADPTSAETATKKPKVCFAEEVVTTMTIKHTDQTQPTKVVAIDCEYVGGGFESRDNILARVSIVNQHGHCFYDKYVTPTEKVTDFRTAVSGIRPSNLRNAENFKKVQKEVSDLLADRIVVGHALQNDFKVLSLAHPRRLTRDTAKYKLFRQMANCFKTPSLKHLAQVVLGIQIQEGEHDSVTDAKVAMQLYTLHRKKWESDIGRYQRGKKP